MPMTRDPDRLEAARAAAVESLAAYLRAGRDVAFLTIGDVTAIPPTATCMNAKAMGFPVEMIAGVPSFARRPPVWEPLTTRQSPAHHPRPTRAWRRRSPFRGPRC
ncbi:MAG: SAM-dependent methyltransferase [Anaerotruncus massiliensis (ex Togo et al. 2019)]